MDNIIVKVLKVFTVVIMLTAAVLTAFVVAYADDMQTDPALANKILNPIFGVGLFLLGLGILATLGFAIAQMISKPKSAIMVLSSIGLLGVIYLIAYLSASGNTDAKVYQVFDINSMQSKLIGSLIYLVYFLGGLSILAIIFSGINKLMLKR